MTQDVHFKIVCNTGSRQNKKQLAVGCEYIHIGVNGHQLTVLLRVGVHGKLHDQFSAARYSNPPWSIKAFVCTVHKLKHPDVVSVVIFVN